MLIYYRNFVSITFLLLLINTCSPDSIVNLTYINEPHLRQQSSLHRVCYYTTPSEPFSNNSIEKLKPDRIDPYICTHLILAFAQINGTNIVPKNKLDIEIYKDALRLKNMNPSLKILISVDQNFDQLIKSKSTIDTFAFNAAQFLKKYQFDGLDLHWISPSTPCRPSLWSTKQWFTYIVTQLSNSLRLASHPPFLLSIAVGATEPLIKCSYEVKELARNVDFVNLMSFNFRHYLPFFPFTGHNSPLHKGQLDRGIFSSLNVEYAVKHWLSLGMPRSKIVVGIPTFGRSWKLLSPKWNKIGAPSTGPGIGNGFVSYSDAVDLLRKGAVSHFDSFCKVHHVSLGRDWISFESRKSIRIKVEWVKRYGLAGVMTWTLNNDDFLGIEAQSIFPLHRTLYETLH